jgi:hypothetical protein
MCVDGVRAGTQTMPSANCPSFSPLDNIYKNPCKTRIITGRIGGKSARKLTNFARFSPILAIFSKKSHFFTIFFKNLRLF